MAKAINVSEQRQRVINASPALGSWLRRIAFFILLLGIWQGLAMSGVWPDYLFPGPLAVFNALVDGFQSGQFLQASVVSLQRLAIGYGISLVIGVVLGLLIGRVRQACAGCRSPFSGWD
jgi:NitT/TauT family transport system permease protein